MRRTAVLLPLIFALFVTLTAQPSVSSQLSSSEIGKSTVRIVDEHYLYVTSNPAWKKVRSEILAAQVDDREAMYELIARQLAKLRDSELHLVSKTELTALNEESKGTRIGTGLIDFGIDLVPRTTEARIVTPLIGSPAAAAGLRPRDVIVSVNGKPTRTLDHEQVLETLRHSSEIHLLIRRGRRRRYVTLARSNDPLKPVLADLKSTAAAKLAYIRIVQITPDAADKVRAAVMMFESEGPIGYILDLRNNPGGSLDSAASIAGIFTSGTLGEKLRANGNKEQISFDKPPLVLAPVVVLVNEGTASAGEFIAAALQDRKRAKLVGTPTYGRGQAQVYVPLSDSYGLIVPSALMRSPRGRLYKGRGLSPDVIVGAKIRRDSDLATALDRQFQTAVALLHRL